MPVGPEQTLMAAELAREWASRLSAAVAMMAQQQPDIAVHPSSAIARSAPGSLVLGYVFSNQPLVKLDVETPEETWAGVARMVLSASGIDEVDAALLKETWEEMLSQASSGLAQGLGMRTGQSVSCSHSVDDTISDQGIGFEVAIELGETRFAPLVIHVPPALAQVYAGSIPVAQNAEVVQAQEGPRTPPALDLLLDVELPVSISFGRTFLPVRDVLKLATGSIIELDRPVNEPVEVVVNNCVIARGEVVVIDGNYGVRIHEIISRRDRMALQHMTNLNPFQPMRITA